MPEKAFDNLVRLGVTLDALALEARLDAMAIRCWTEMQIQMGISPCVAMGLLNDAGLAAACEVDLGNAVVMRALHLAAYAPAGEFVGHVFNVTILCVIASECSFASEAISSLPGDCHGSEEHRPSQ